MKNFEKFEKEIMEIVATGNGFAVVNNNITKCINTKCNDCELKTDNCFEDRYRWMFSEYKERPKLTKHEKAFVDFMGADLYLARDKMGGLFLHNTKPEKNEFGWSSCACYFPMNEFRINDDMFPFIKYEDEEPWSIEELSKLEVEE